MKRLSFLKSLFLLPLSFYSKHNEVLIDAQFVDHPPTLSKRLSFRYKKRKFEIFITDQILITSKDNEVFLNVYGEYYKVCGSIIIENAIKAEQKCLRFEGPTFHRDEVKKYWKEGIKRAIEIGSLTQEKQFSNITEIPRIVKF